MKKIFELSELCEYLKNFKNKTIVLTGGVFNFLTPYHIDLFEFADSRGDYLVVAVESSKVYTPPEERLEILEAIGSIDFLVLYDKKEDMEVISEYVGEIVFNDEFDFLPEEISYSGESVFFPS